MLTQTEWAKLNPDPLQSGVVEIFASTNPVMQYMPYQNIAGAAYVYNREQMLPGIAFRGIGESYTASTGIINQLSDPLKIVGGDLDVDTALVAWGVGPNDTRAIHDGMKVKGTAHATDNDNGPNFQMRSVPDGFTHSAHSPNPWKQAFQHECGGQVAFDII